MRKRTSDAEPSPAAADARDAPVLRFVIVTMDSHLASSALRAGRSLAHALPGAVLTVHAASEWGADAAALQRCLDDIARAHIVVAAMLFMEEHYLPVLPALQARREHCDAMVCAMSASEVMRLTRMGRFSMAAGVGGPIAFLKRLGSRGKPAQDDARPNSGNGARQLRMLRRLPKLLRFVPGTAQDLRAYLLTLQYWLAGSEQNIAAMAQFLIGRYADGPRRVLRAGAAATAPLDYPEVGVYHPRMSPRLSADRGTLPAAPPGARGTIGLLLMRSYLLAGNTGHYDGVIAALEAQGLAVVPAFATGLDARPAIERYFLRDGGPTIDALVSLTGFSLVGGPAYNDAAAAAAVLAQLDRPYLAVSPLEFQTLEQWQASERGLLPIEATMSVSIPELDGATGSMVFGGRSESAADARDMQAHAERASMLAARVAKLIALRRAPLAKRRVAIVLFNFPPNGGATGTAAFLSVFESLHRTLAAMRGAGYGVELPASVDALRRQLLGGNAEKYGTDANVHARIPVADHVRRERWLAPIEAHWGSAPGRQQSDGASLFVLGARFGNVFVGIQPAFGIEGDPMRLLYDRAFAPTHAFSAFYRYLREDFAAHAVLHFGTHGALEFMPGKQAGLSGECWPDRLIGDLPNVYLYAANNPSEGTLAKRRAAATLVSYLTPPITQAGLYRGLAELKQSVERWRADPAKDGPMERAELARAIQSQAAALSLAEATPGWGAAADAQVARLVDTLVDYEQTLIPQGLHVVGQAPSTEAQIDTLLAMAGAMAEEGAAPEGATNGAANSATSGPTNSATSATTAPLSRAQVAQIVAGAPAPPELDDTQLALWQRLAAADRAMRGEHEIAGLLRALDGRYVPPAPGGDLLRTPEILPTGRNLHGFDPFRLPSPHAVREGARLAAQLLERHAADGHALPESIALVLWGTDNLKTEGAPIGQALALMGARPRIDSYGRLAGAQLIPLEQLGRPRIDVMVTLSGIFRDLLPLQIKLLAEAAHCAAVADEPEHLNFVRKHALAWQREHGGDMETAALRVFGNAEGAYGANVNHLIECSRWEDGDELAEAFTRRKGHAYGRNGRPQRQAALLVDVLSRVELTCQNLDSVELGVTTIDTYFDTLGGVSRAVQRARGQATPVYIGDSTRGDGGSVRTLAEQVSLETRTRMLNPKWYEGLLAHGYEGVRQIETHVTNTMGWSATTGQVATWVYRELTETFMLDPAMRERLARLNPAASAKVAHRLLEASRRAYWQADAATLAALQDASDELEDRLEGVYEGVPA